MGDKLPLGRRKFLKATGSAALLASMGQAAAQGPNNGRRRGPKEDEILVGVSKGASDHRKEVEKHVPEHAQAVHDCPCLRYVAVRFNENANKRAKENFKERVQKKEYIKYAEDNETLSTSYTPDDTRYGDQYADQMVNAAAAWDTTLGSSSVTVAVVDTGIKYDHPDLANNMSSAMSNHGYDFVDDDADPYPDVLVDEYHGTHVAGIVAGEIDNGQGISGMGNSTIMSGRALSEEGTGSTSDIADAVTWAADNGADVINMSIGGGGYTQTMKDAVSYAYNTQGCLIVCAAGNASASSVEYPSAYSECLAVSALDPDGTMASYSNTGSKVELCAPGTNVLSTWIGDDYNKISGTSMATPVVAGVAGLTLAQWDISNTELRDHLKATAVDMGLSSTQQGSGRVDAGNAVNTDPASTGGGETDSTTVSDTLTSSSDSNCWSYAWTYSNPSQVEVDLSGPGSADFDLYVSDGTGACPTTYSYDYYSYSANSEETVTISAPDDSTDLHILVDSYSGSGSYDLTITETQ